MGWKSLLFGYAVLLALALGARGQTAYAPPQRLDPATALPRYAVMGPPAQADAQPDPAPPAAAPTAPVTVTPASPTAPTKQWQPPHYSAMDQSDNIESVTVSALRQSQDSLYRLGTGDKLRVTVFNETDLSGEFEIDSQGYVRLPLLGQVQAAGLSTFGLESRIAAALNNGGYLVNPRVAVEVTTYRPFYIIGEIAKPGEYAYVNAMTAPNAVALAGGYTDRAVESMIWIRHQGEVKERELPADETTRIQPGDVVRVGRTTYWSIMTMLAPLISPFTSAAYLLK